MTGLGSHHGLLGLLNAVRSKKDTANVRLSPAFSNFWQEDPSGRRFIMQWRLGGDRMAGARRERLAVKQDRPKKHAFTTDH